MHSKINTPLLLDKINQPSLLETQCDQLKEAIQQERNYYISRLTLLEQKLDKLKSSLVTPIRPTGHWFIDERPESDREVICSNCEQPIFKYHKLDFDYRPKFCPNCGSNNREVEE